MRNYLMTSWKQFGIGLMLGASLLSPYSPLTNTADCESCCEEKNALIGLLAEQNVDFVDLGLTIEESYNGKRPVSLENIGKRDIKKMSESQIIGLMRRMTLALKKRETFIPNQPEKIVLTDLRDQVELVLNK